MKYMSTPASLPPYLAIWSPSLDNGICASIPVILASSKKIMSTRASPASLYGGWSHLPLLSVVTLL